MATATAFLELNITGFEKALASAKRALTVLGSAFLTYKSVKFLEGQAEEALDFAQSLFQVSRAMGNMDTGQLLLSQKALEQIGYSASGATARIQELVGAGVPLSITFGGAANYSNQLQQAAKMWGNSAAILSKVGDRFSMVWDRLQAVFGKGREFLLGMLSGFIEPLKVLFDKILTMNLAGIGERFGQSIGKAITTLNGAMATNSLGSLISAAMEVGSAYISNAFSNGFDLIVLAATAVGVAANSAIVQVNWGEVGYAIFRTFGIGFISLFREILWGLNNLFGSVEERLAALVDLIPGVNGNADSVAQRTANNGIVIDKMMDDWKKSMTPAGSLTSIDFAQQKRELSMFGPQIMAILSKDLGDSPQARLARTHLAELGDAAFKAGGGLQGKDGKGQMGTTKADPFKVIGDSLARIGGGGGALRVGMTIEAKNSIMIARATNQTAANTQIIADMARAGTARTINFNQP